MRNSVDILISNGLIVTMDSERRVVSNGYVAVSNGRIVDVGKGDGRDKYIAEEHIDARKSIVMPGLMCAHTHFYGLLLNGCPWLNKIEYPTDFIQKLQRVWWVLDNFITHEDAYVSALVGSMRFLRSGVTFFFDNISAPNSIDRILDSIEKAVLEIGIRGYLSFESTQRRSYEEGFKGLRENERFIIKNNLDPDNLVKGAIFLHSCFTVSDDLLIEARRLADKYNAIISIHVEEGLIDVYHNMERYGIRPIERMYKLGFLNKDVILVHVVNTTTDELKIISKTGSHVAHNPMSNMLNAVGVARIPEMIELGINIGLGNDGYVFDQFENMRAAYLIHKLWYRDPRLITPLQVLEMSTVNTAKMFKVDNELASIEIGKKADILIIKPEHPSTPVNENTVYHHIVNYVNSRDVDTVIVNGNIVLKNKKIVRIDEEKAIEYATRVVEKLWDRLMEKGVYKIDYYVDRK
ncbi:MAG: amidohydrolase [Desulfurococcaceae archaeon]